MAPMIPSSTLTEWEQVCEKNPLLSGCLRQYADEFCENRHMLEGFLRHAADIVDTLPQAIQALKQERARWERLGDVQPGDIIRIPLYMCGHEYDAWEGPVEVFRGCLGIFFREPADRTAQRFTPLCDLYMRGPESKQDYIPNYGEYFTNQVPAFTVVSKGAPANA
jgi:hypothetical protein